MTIYYRIITIDGRILGFTIWPEKWLKDSQYKRGYVKFKKIISK